MMESSVEVAAIVRDSSSLPDIATARARQSALSASVCSTIFPSTVRMFRLKDIFTCINLLGGTFSIIFCIQGDTRYAAYAFLLGYLLGDALDGLVARLTHTGNRFGKEFDAISDHLAQCIAPACIIFSSYQKLSFWLAAFLTSIVIVTGSIRHARSAVSATNFPLAYLGLPRTASSFVIVSFLNSTLFLQMPGGQWVGAPLLVILSIAHLLPLPFRTHRGREKIERYVKILIIAFFSTTLAALLFFPKFVFDVTFCWLFSYTFGSWIALRPDERRAFFARAREWSEEVKRAS